MRNPVSKFFTLVAICLSACVAMKGTTVVVIWTPDHVVVGADSRVTYNAMGSKESFADNGCKIMQEGHVLYASSGFSKQFQYFLVSDSIKHATSISQAASSFGQRGEVLAQELRVRPKGYLEHFDGHPHIDAVFFGMEAEAAKVVRLKFIQKGKTADSLELIPVIKECPGDCPKDQKRIAFCIGECNIITKPETNPMNPIFIGARPDEDVIRDLIEREEMADKYVGGPIDIVRIDRKGSHWAFNAEGTCSPDEKKPSIPAHKKRGSSAK